MAYDAAKENFRVALAGDCMLTRRLSVFDEPAFLALRDLFRGCDAGFVNLESVVRRPDEGTPGVTRGTYMTTPPELLSDLSWLGVTMVANANNHAYDYGEGGLMATIRHLTEAGIMFAGSGQNLAEARRPGYLDTRAGRVALIATTATYRPWNAASPQRPDMRGRPGINPLGSRPPIRSTMRPSRRWTEMSEGSRLQPDPQAQPHAFLQRQGGAARRSGRDAAVR